MAGNLSILPKLDNDDDNGDDNGDDNSKQVTLNLPL